VTFARGNRALGICDRCGQRFLLNTLREETVAGVGRNNRVCDSCFDSDHPQNWLGRTPVIDPQALRFSRPDIAESPVAPYTPPYIGPGNQPV
jgi:hypothetical protein